MPFEKQRTTFTNEQGIVEHNGNFSFHSNRENRKHLYTIPTLSYTSIIINARTVKPVLRPIMNAKQHKQHDSTAGVVLTKESRLIAWLAKREG